MELLDTVLFKLNLKTADIRTVNIQEVLLAIKKNSVNSEHLGEYYENILEKLWLHLMTELQEFDDQLLCSICFYTVLCKTNKQEIYLTKVFNIVNNELNLKESNLSESKISLAVSLCYGIFQSSYLLQQSINSNVSVETTLKVIFQFLVLKAYEYTQYTFIVFKVMTSFKKVIGTELQDVLFNTDNQIKLLNMINHNWENPITGIRNLNRIVFQTLLVVLNQNIHETILTEINSFYWNKAKYLMLAEIIEQYKGKIKCLLFDNKWIDALVYSLSKPGLVSAGTDMYSAVLKKTHSDEIWATLFMPKVMEILNGTCFKTIENFSNYWCLNTFKKFPTLMHLLINEMDNINNSEYSLFSAACIIKQGTKLGLSGKEIANCDYEMKNEKIVTLGLEHCNTSIRLVVFEIISVSQRNCLPSINEYEQILKYLFDNVNCDCTVLRISMINNLGIFLNKVHTLFLNTAVTDNNKDVQNLISFCEKLQNFVMESIDLNGNYQRKITSVKIAQTILKNINQLKPKKRNKDTRESNKSLAGFLKESGHWKLNAHAFVMKLLDLLKDPASDVNEGVLQLLSEFYIKELSDAFIMNFLIEEGLKCIASKFFYEISCGQIMFKLVINILLKNSTIDSRFNNLEDIFQFAFNEISSEHSSKKDIIKSIEDGKQLHSFLNILSIIFEVSIKNTFVLNISKDAIFSLLSIIDCISNQFVWEEDLSTCSDFSKMSDMVQTLIKTSGLEMEDGNDHTRISGLHQIVLNCLWLNVKASCELASLLIQYYKHDQSICEKCLNIITHALETSRHKGAIEAGGTALGSGIQCLSSLPDEQVVSKLPFFLLKTKLKDLLFETTKMSSVTRRGAGLSIMVHRIVSNDLKKGKPLFHYFMRTLLDMCKSIDDTSYSKGTCEIDNEKDLPKAIYIHFLTRIVTDSSLASDTMFYAAELAALAFNNLINNHWQIRNAALQLYGALIPKLIGQKKASGTDENTIATVACDEFRTHSPKLWEYIIKQIAMQNDYEDIIQAHSNLVPILNVLASLANRYNFSFDLKEQNYSDSNILLNLLSLLGSPIYTIRRLTSQCITNMYSFDKLFNILQNIEIPTENYLHGVLMLISNCYKYYSDTELIRLNRLTEKYQDILKQRSQSYLCRWSLNKICKETENITIKIIQNILCEVNKKRYEPGVSLWANSKIQNYIEYMPWSIVPDTMSLLLQTHEFDLYSDIFIKKIQDSIKPCEEVLLELAKILLSSEIIFKSSTLWKLLYTISLKINMDVEIYNICGIQDHIRHTSYKLRYLIPFATRLLIKQRNNEGLLILSQSINLLCNPETNDVDMRHIAALANNEFGNELQCYSDDVKINVIKSAIILLQDEDEDVRLLSVCFYKNFKKESKHPFICLNYFLKQDFLYEILNEPRSIQIICNDLLHFVESICASKHNEYNPFSNDSKNIYLEKDLFKQTLQNLIKLYS